MEENKQEPIPAQPKTGEPESLELLQYREKLAADIGLPSSYGMNLLKKYCEDMIASGLVPGHFKGNPMSVYLAVMRGRELQLSPTESILETFWSAPNGKLGMYSAKMMDIMHRRGVKSKFIQEDNQACVIQFTPPGGHEPYTSTFEYAEASNAGLVKSGGAWVAWRKDMLRARCISRAWRALAGTFGTGGGTGLYSKEELEDMQVEEEINNLAAPPPEVVIGTKPKKAKATEPVVTVDARPDPLMNAAAATPPALPDMAAQSPRGAAFADETAGPDPDPAHSKESVMNTYDEVMAGADPQKRFYTAPPADKTQAPKATETQAPAPEPRRSGPTEVSATPSETSNAARDRLASLYPKTPGKTAEEKKKNAHSFLSGWFGINNPSLWPKNAVDRQAALDALEKAIAEEPAEVLMYKAHQTGAKRREQSEQDDSAGYYAKLGWGDSTRMAAKALKRRFSHSPEDFAEFCQHFGLNKLPEADAAAFLSFAAAAGRGNSLLKQIRELSARLGDGYASIVGSIEHYKALPVVDIPVADLEHYFQRVTERLNAEAPPSSGNTEEIKAGS